MPSARKKSGAAKKHRVAVKKVSPKKKPRAAAKKVASSRGSTAENALMRDQLAKVLSWGDAHATLEAALKDLPPELRARRASGMPYTVWALVEHLRLAQHDILDFCVNPAYEEMKWPDDYWPPADESPSEKAWGEAIAAIQRDRDAVAALARNTKIDLFAKIPHGSGQTYLREILLVIDHNAYHVGQIVLVRRALGAWPA